MEHSYKKRNQNNNIQHSEEGTGLAGAQDLETMDLVEQQEFAGNDFVAQQTQRAAQTAAAPPPASLPTGGSYLAL